MGEVFPIVSLSSYIYIRVGSELTIKHPHLTPCGLRPNSTKLESNQVVVDFREAFARSALTGESRKRFDAFSEGENMEWLLLLVFSVLLAMALLAGQSYVSPRFAQLQSIQASYAGNVAVTAGFLFLAILIVGFALHMVDKELPQVPKP
jgi:hypothetical protein